MEDPSQLHTCSYADNHLILCIKPEALQQYHSKLSKGRNETSLTAAAAEPVTGPEAKSEAEKGGGQTDDGGWSGGWLVKNHPALTNRVILASFRSEHQVRRGALRQEPCKVIARKLRFWDQMRSRSTAGTADKTTKHAV
ncbi:hypothetical protein TWF718_005166 [Orbilia javanica]|uniref:Uncharacterized protein n=1 Tax=Orbilia javanica TaxID=47235 RepID=A0AAN8RR61_9PEZI